MARIVYTSLVLAISIAPLYAQSSFRTDRSGYTAGTDGNRTVNTYTDRYGNTTGWVGCYRWAPGVAGIMEGPTGGRSVEQPQRERSARLFVCPVIQPPHSIH